MSIVRQLLTISAVQAMRGQTLAGPCVFDSQISVLSDALDDARRPVIIVSIEGSEQPDHGIAQSLLGRTANFKLLVQAAVFELQKMAEADGGEPEELEYVLGETDAAFEATLNLMDRQWRGVLSQPRNAWAEIFRGLVQRVGTINDIRATDPKTGRRHALRLTQVEIEAIADPVPGEDLPPAIEAGLAALEAMADYAETAAAWRSVLADFAGLEDWELSQARMFMARGTMDALGLAPLVQELTNFDRATIEMDGLGTFEEDGSDG